MADGKSRPFRLTRGRISFEFTLLIMAVIWAGRFATWGVRRLRPIVYHPVAIAGIIVFTAAYILSAWLVFALILSVYVWAFVWPDSYLQHGHWRLRSFLAGLRIRYRPRRKLTACALLNSEDPVPTISDVRRQGCVTIVRVKMSHGDEIEWWRERSARLAQTYNSLDCKVNPYRRRNFTTFRLDGLTSKKINIKGFKVSCPAIDRAGFIGRPPFIRHHFSEPPVIKPRWAKMEFLTKDPFTKAIGPEYIEFHRTDEALPEEGNPVGPYRDGTPHRFMVRTHKLVVAPSQRGKSNALRAMIYADHRAVQAGLVENWGCDLKRGVEINFMENQFARTEYGLDGPEMVARFFEDAQAVMNRRLDSIREGEEDVRHIASPKDPALRIYIDEFLAFEDTEYNDHRSRIYRAISAIHRRGAAAEVSIIAFAQDPKKDKFPLRDGFLEVEVGGGLTQIQVGMVMPGGWEAGARTGDIDLPGVFFVRTEALLVPEQFRYCYITNGTIRSLPRRPNSVLWPPSEEEQRDISGVLIA